MIKYSSWYNLPSVKFALIKFTQNRETALLSTVDGKTLNIRDLRMHSTQHIDIIQSSLQGEASKRIFNWYISTGRYKQGVPVFPLKIGRDTSEWKKNHWKELECVDFFVDIDAPTHREIGFAKESAILISDFFDNLNVPYYLRFSGCGFHFIIDGDRFEKRTFEPNKKDSIYRYYGKIRKYLSDHYSELIDPRASQDSRRLMKLPYSIAYYFGKQYVCTPLRNKERLINFRLDDYTPEKILDHFRLRLVGTHLFNPHGNTKLLHQKVIDEYGDD